MHVSNFPLELENKSQWTEKLKDVFNFLQNHCLGSRSHTNTMMFTISWSHLMSERYCMHFLSCTSSSRELTSVSNDCYTIWSVFTATDNITATVKTPTCRWDGNKSRHWLVGCERNVLCFHTYIKQFLVI